MSLYGAGMGSINARDDRLLEFAHAYDKGFFYTLAAASKYMNLSVKTCRQYAKEIGLSIYDHENEVWTEGRKPKGFK